MAGELLGKFIVKFVVYKSRTGQLLPNVAGMISTLRIFY
jgi:hypothetical protein